MDSSGSLCFLIDPYASLLVFIGLYKFSYVVMDSNGSLCVRFCPDSMVCDLMGPNGSMSPHIQKKEKEDQ